MSLRSVGKRGCACVSGAVLIVRFAAVFATGLIAGLSGLPSQAHARDDPSISLTKTASPTTYSAAGQVITYTYVVTLNSGDPYNIEITDDKVGDFYCGSVDGMSTPLTCTRTYTITADDVTAGSVTNTATAIGNCGMKKSTG